MIIIKTSITLILIKLGPDHDVIITLILIKLGPDHDVIRIKIILVQSFWSREVDKTLSAIKLFTYS